MSERVLDTFLDLVRIDSPSLSEAAVAAYCESALEQAGCEVRLDDSARITGSDTGNLIATLPAVGSDRTLLLSAHMDCVEPCRGVVPVVEDGLIRPAGETVLGADDKAGVAAIIETVRRLAAHDGPRPALRVILTVAEEIGLSGAKALDPKDVNGDLCLVLDADGVPGGIVIAAPTHYTFVATFKGLASHAGVAPEEGRSAIVMAARAICAMRTGRLDQATTANVGTISGGTATNVVAPTAIVTGECRSLDDAEVEIVRQEMETAMREAAATGRGSVDIAWTREYGSFSMPATGELPDLVAEVCRDIGLVPSTTSSGGGSDANILAGHGVPTLVLSCGMQGLHSTSERMAVSDLLALADLVEAVALRFATQG